MTQIWPVTPYFQNTVLVKHPYLRLEWCILAIREPIRREVQLGDGRIRHWRWVEELGRYLRVGTLPDGETIHNAFPDRRFKP